MGEYLRSQYIFSYKARQTVVTAVNLRSVEKCTLCPSSFQVATVRVLFRAGHFIKIIELFLERFWNRFGLRDREIGEPFADGIRQSGVQRVKIFLVREVTTALIGTGKFSSGYERGIVPGGGVIWSKTECTAVITFRAFKKLR
jgi:hypothetical protein